MPAHSAMAYGSKVPSEATTIAAAAAGANSGSRITLEGDPFAARLDRGDGDLDLASVRVGGGEALGQESESVQRKAQATALAPQRSTS